VIVSSPDHSPSPKAGTPGRHYRERLARAGRRSLRIPLLMLHTLAGVVIAAALGPGRQRRYTSTRPLVWWSQGLCWILRIRRQISGEMRQGPVLFVANHISWLDIFCIAAVCPTHFLAKQDVTTWPLFGWLCRRAGTAFIRRGGDNGAAMEQLVQRLQQGERVLVFPEGTSTSGTAVRRFFPRLFEAAILTGCPVQAIALRYPSSDGCAGPHSVAPFVGDDELLPHLWRVLGEPEILMELHFGAVHTTPHSSRDCLARSTHAEISAQVLQTKIHMPPNHRFEMTDRAMLINAKRINAKRSSTI